MDEGIQNRINLLLEAGLVTQQSVDITMKILHGLGTYLNMELTESNAGSMINHILLASNRILKGECSKPTPQVLNEIEVHGQKRKDIETIVKKVYEGYNVSTQGVSDEAVFILLYVLILGN